MFVCALWLHFILVLVVHNRGHVAIGMVAGLIGMNGESVEYTQDMTVKVEEEEVERLVV